MPKFKESLLKSVLAAMLIRAFTIGSAFAVTVLLARQMSPDLFGRYAFAIAIVQILALPVLSGAPALLVREVAKNREEPNKTRSLIFNAFRFVLIFSFSASVLSGLVIFMFGDQINADSRSVLFWAAALLPFWAMATITGASLRGLGLLWAGQSVETLFRPLFLALFVFAIYLFPFDERFSLTPTFAIQLHIVAAAAAFAIGVYVSALNWPKSTSPSWATKNEGWLQALIPFSMIAGLQILFSKTDIVMLQILRSSADVGIYQIAIQLSLLAYVSKQAIAMVIEPQLAVKVKNEKFSEVQVILSKSATYLFAAALPVCIVLMLFGEQIIVFIFGLQYSAAYGPVLVFCIGYLLQSLLGNIDTFLKMANWERRVAIALAVAAVSNVVLNFLLVPSYGVVGAAIASVISTISYRVYLNAFAFRKLGTVAHAFGWRF